METLGPLLDVAYEDIAQKRHQASIGYSASWGSDESLDRSAADFASTILAAMETSRKVDYERRLTSVGPHRDEPVFRIDGTDARTHASQGEQRTMALAVKLAAHRAVNDLVGEPPVLLLDDVFSELDPDRAAALAKALPDSTQTMISSARPEDIPLSGSVWKVGEGVER